MSEERSVELVVRSAEKRDAGRGVARLPESARRTLGVLSGDTVVVEGTRPTVAKVWPGTGDGLRIDADTRANAGVNVGDTVVVRPVSVSDADSVSVSLSAPVDAEDLPDLVQGALLDRPLRTSETVRLDRLGVHASVERTTPDGTVRVTEETRVDVTAPAAPSPPSSPSPPCVSTNDEDGDVAPPKRGTTYEDIGGLDDELEQIREMIELPLSEPDLFRRLGIDPPKGVLLHGPPGTGKTLIARAVANEVDAHFTVISGPEVVSKYKGESEEKLRETFDEAERNAPAVVFIDEIDSIGGRRDEEADMENRVVAQLLTLLDGLDERGQVVVVGATNRLDSLDPALRRGGRFDREIEIGVPDARGRREILEVHTRSMPLADDVELDQLANRTHGFVGADLHSLVTEAAMATLGRRTRGNDEGADSSTSSANDGSEAILQVTRADFEVAMAAVEPSAMREYVAETPSVTFDDVGGLEEVKAQLREAVEWPLVYGPLFEATNTEPPSGILLHGPPGTGKTLLARSLAGESEVNFVHVAGPELLDRYVGESERSVREVFDRARQAAPTIVFFDEIDAIAGQRGSRGDDGVTDRIVSQLLTELDGLVDNPSVMVLAATNRPDVLDRALLRPGRLEEHVEVPTPDQDVRRAILQVLTRRKPLADNVDLDTLASETDGFSGADLEALVRRASMRAIRTVATDLDPAEAKSRAGEIRITRKHFETAKASVASSVA